MAVTNTQIRDLLNRPKGLNEGTITEYVTIRTNQVAKLSRGDLYGVATANQVSTALTDDATKMLVCVDCLRVLIDTMPMYVPENEFRQQDIRLQAQLGDFRKQAQASLDLIAEAGGTAFYITSMDTNME